jgi:hypothetical protein
LRRTQVPATASQQNSCMNIAHRPDSFVPAGHRAIPRRRWPAVLGLAVLGLAAAAAYGTLAPRAYTATASVYVSAIGQPAAPAGSAVLLPSQVPDMRGEARTVRSAGVAAAAGRLLHSSQSPQALSQQVTVTASQNLPLLHIACRASSAAGASSCANGFAKAYLAQRASHAAGYRSSAAIVLDHELRSLQRAGASLGSKIAGLPAGSPQRASDEATLKADQAQLARLRYDARAVARQHAYTSGGRIVALATPPNSGSGGPSWLLVLPAGLVAGLLAGLITAFLPRRSFRRAAR